ncbi:hypothetical protein Moror_8994 [Moniliophthora roreri MCA 2997]|uniref:Uncharacterized protein n=1 Tax=Moniliophthora roreri (strain MCA 2997) TaxID=1381753 RepID=V2XJ90_MONRO|nr:hypothetical protein Moror_8994 [Moniliophthora roreri MCA 2997]
MSVPWFPTLPSSWRKSGQRDGAASGLAANSSAPAGSRFSEPEEVQRTTTAGVPAANPFAHPSDNASTDATTDGNQQQQAQQPHVPFYKRRKFIICQLIAIPLGIALLFILLFPVVKAIVQLTVNKSDLQVESAAISSPQNNTFKLALQGKVIKTGPIPATIDFKEPIQVSWIEENGKDTLLGTMTLGDTLYARHKQATVNQTTQFNISDEDAFGRFTQHMITAQNFTWRLQSDDLKVQAAKFPVSNGIKFDKRITINGVNNFAGKVDLKDLQLPSDAEDGSGINFVAVTSLTNTSPFDLDLGTVVFDLTYDNITLGSGNGTNTKLVPGQNEITLKGVLVRQEGEVNLKKMGTLFSNYINGIETSVIAVGKSTTQNDGTEISWLSKGLQALQLRVPFKPSNGPINPIKSIDIGDLALQFSPDTAWSPSADSRSVRATLELPFGFNLAIGEIENDFNITEDGNVVAGLKTPLGASQSEVRIEGPAKTTGSIDITITDTRLNCPDPSHPIFSAFNANLTSQNQADFQLIGNSRAIANLSIGQIELNPIMFNVSSGLQGLQGLKGLTKIESVDVQGGTTKGVILGIDVSINNPSNLKLSTGDLTLQLYRDGALLGSAVMPNLTLNMGMNNVTAKSTFAANDSPLGLQTLNDFVGKKDVQLSISGYDGSTQVASLLEAFKTLNIDVTLPALQTNLLDTAALKVLPTTGRENNISRVTVDLENPFSADLKITNIKSTVSAFGIPLGSIDSTTDFDSQPHSKTTSPELDLNMNFDPNALFTITRALAVEAGLDTAQLDGIVELGGYSYLSTTGNPPEVSNSRRANIYTGFELPPFIQAAFKKLKSDVELTASVSIGDYNTQLTYTQSTVPTNTDESLNLILPVLAQPIVQKIVSGATLGISTVLIKDPQQNSFSTQLRGSIANAGPFDAKIAFPTGLTVSWAGKSIGTIQMNDVDVVGDIGAEIDLESKFQVADVDHIAQFTKTLLTEESFEWEISGDNLTVSALGIEVSGVSLGSKKVILKGFNGLKGGIKVESFDLPSNDPAGGIHLALQASTTNPSQVGIELSSIAFDSYAQDVLVAPVVSEGSISLAPQSTSTLDLVGRLIPQESQHGLDVVSTIFNNFVHGKDSDLVVHGAGAGSSDVTWLNEGIRILQVETVLPNRGPQNIIKSISLNELTLLFSSDTAYNPSTTSSNSEAAFTLPFGFPIDISALEQTIKVAYQGNQFATLAVPKGPSSTDVENRIIHLTFNNVPFTVSDGGHDTFDTFLADTTMGRQQTIGLSGSANANAQTAVGLVSLSDIQFSVDSTIEGLQGLNARPVTVSNLDVRQGFADFLLITVDGDLFNPSNLTIGTGDVSFLLQFDNQVIGTSDLKNLVIKPGNQSYPIEVHFAPQGAAASAGRTLLQNFIQGVDVDTSISGSRDSTPVESLKTALSQIRLSPITIPALHESLIKSASLVFPTDIVQTGVAQTSFELANPFTASINLLEVHADAVYHDLRLGTIDTDVSSNPIHADGHSTISSPTLPINFNLDPSTIIQLLKIASQANGIDLGPLNELFQFVLDNPDLKPPVTSSVTTEKPTCVSGHQFDFEGAILNSLKNLVVDLQVDSSVKLDEYATDLSFAQHNVSAITDDTALYLIGAVAGPIAQHIVDGAELKFSEANITSLSDDGFDLALRGSLTNAGPLDAQIEFTEPLTVHWQDNVIATINLPPVCAAANDGVPNYVTTGRLTITDLSQFTSFATFLLHNPDFEWTVSTSKLRVTALGTIFDNISLSKTIGFKAFNNLPGVTIANFELPSDDPEGGIHIETDSTIPSPAQLGIDLGTVSFSSSFNGTFIGPLSASDLFLAPNVVTTTHLSGRIVPQSGSDLENIGKLFTGYLAAKNQTLSVTGDSVQPSGGQTVTWLSEAFKTLTLEVTLPGQKFDIITSIALDDLDVILETPDQTFAPLTSANKTVAQYKNPFGFSLQAIEAGQTITLSSGGTPAAELMLPKGPVDGGLSTGNIADLHITWSNQPLKSVDNGAFKQLFVDVTLKDNVDLALKGKADVTARTTIGDVPIGGIEFDVPSSLKGINSFGGRASLADVRVTGSGGQGGSEYIVAPLKTTLDNPSEVSLHTVDTELPVIYKGTKIGRASISPFNLLPGENIFDSEFHYKPDNANDSVAQSFLADFLTTGSTLDLEIQGDAASSPFESLQEALSGVKISTQLTGMDQKLLQHINVFITLDSLVTNLVSIDFDISNPLDADLVLEFLQSDGGVNGDIYAHFEAPINLVVPAKSTVNSGTIENVILTKGALASLDIIPLGFLDIFVAATARVGQGGYQTPWLKLDQMGVPTHYELDLGLALSGLKGVAESLSKESVAETATTDSVSTSKGPPSTQSAGTTSTQNERSSSTSASEPTSTSGSGDNGGINILPTGNNSLFS